MSSIKKYFFCFSPIVYIFALISCFSTGFLHGQDATKWQIFSPPGQSFEVFVPGSMKSGEKKILTDVGYMHPVTWLYQSTDGDPNYLYTVSYVDYPEGTFHSDSTDLIKELFDTSIDANIGDLNGQLVYQSEQPYGNHQGVIYRAAYNGNKAVVKGRMILCNDRFYAIQVFTLSEKSLNPDMDKFLNSFKLKK
ncbi:MAG: hypothetical protein WAU01_07165 [Saprospiraceae bacterium]